MRQACPTSLRPAVRDTGPPPPQTHSCIINSNTSDTVCGSTVCGHTVLYVCVYMEMGVQLGSPGWFVCPCFSAQPLLRSSFHHLPIIMEEDREQLSLPSTRCLTGVCVSVIVSMFVCLMCEFLGVLFLDVFGSVWDPLRLLLSTPRT